MSLRVLSTCSSRKHKWKIVILEELLSENNGMRPQLNLKSKFSIANVHYLNPSFSPLKCIFIYLFFLVESTCIFLTKQKVVVLRLSDFL